MRGRLPLLLALLALPLLPNGSASQPNGAAAEPVSCGPALLARSQSVAWVDPDGLLVERSGGMLLLNSTDSRYIAGSHTPTALSPDGRWLALASHMWFRNDILRNHTGESLSEAGAVCPGHAGFVVDLANGTRTPLPGAVRGLVGGPGGLVVVTETAVLVYAWGEWSQYRTVLLPRAEASSVANDSVEGDGAANYSPRHGPFTSVTLSDDARTLAVVTHDGALHLLDVATGTPVHPDFPAVHFNQAQIAHVAFAPGGARLAAVTSASTLWHASAPERGSELHVIAVRGPAFGIVATTFQAGWPRGLAWGPAGLAIAVGSQNETSLLRIYDDPVNFTAAAELRTRDRALGPLAWSPDGARLAVAGWGDEARIYAANLSLLERRSYHQSYAPSLHPPTRTFDRPCCEGVGGMMVPPTPMDTVQERYVPAAFGVLALASLAAPALLRRR